METFCCGSNLFGQIEPVCNDTNNTIIKTPQKFNVIEKYGKTCTENQTLHANSSAKSEPEIHCCVCWERSIVSYHSVVRVYGNNQQLIEQVTAKQVAGNARISCILTSSGDLLLEPYPRDENEKSSSQERKLENVKCVGCTEDKVVFVKNDSCSTIQEMDTVGRQAFGSIIEIFAPLPVRAVSCGKEHALLLSTLGTVMSYGSGSRAQLGHGLTESCTQPTVVDALNGLTVLSVTAGGWHSAAITDIGDLYIWGWNESGQLGFPCNHADKVNNNKSQDKEFINILTFPTYLEIKSTSHTAAANTGVPGASGQDEYTVRKVACGSRHTVCLTECGKVFCFGWNAHGQLGLGDTLIRDTPTELKYFSDQAFKQSAPPTEAFKQSAPPTERPATRSDSHVVDVFAGGWNTVFVVTREQFPNYATDTVHDDR